MSWSVAVSCRCRSRTRRGRNAARSVAGARGGVISNWLRIVLAYILVLATAQNIAAQTPDRQPAKEVPVEPVRQVVRGRVAAIVDGDTLHLAAGKVTRVVRLAGIDAPEKGQPFGNAAAQVSSLKLLQKEVDVLVVGAAADRAILGIVYCEGCVNTALVREGIAWHDEQAYPSSALAAAQHEARTAARGLWAEKNPIAPWTWRERAAGRPLTVSAVKPAVAAAPARNGPPEDYSRMFEAETAQKANSPAETPDAAGGPCWLTESSGVRHNNTCRYYKKSQGRPCGENEGRPCKQCGG